MEKSALGLEYPFKLHSGVQVPPLTGALISSVEITGYHGLKVLNAITVSKQYKVHEFLHQIWIQPSGSVIAQNKPLHHEVAQPKSKQKTVRWNLAHKKQMRRGKRSIPPEGLSRNTQQIMPWR